MCFDGVKVSTMKRFLVYDTKLKIYSIKNRRTDFRSQKFVCVALLNSFNDWTSFCQIINLNLPRVQLTKLNSAFKNKKNTCINFQGLNINPDILHVNSELNQTEDFLSLINELDKKCVVPCKVNLTRIATRPTKVPDLQIEDLNNKVSLIDDNNENFKSKAILEMLSPKVDVGHLERNILAKNITEDASDPLTYQSSNAIEESSTILPYKVLKVFEFSKNIFRQLLRIINYYDM
ncbi:uncharacterized protein LOC141530002 [Cotesia typhae]|uniref:uncharacterized protein LOC141530002 n=1 Tax=Cotesia typhae TaxID=2053667 RepID=UPI003D694D95